MAPPNVPVVAVLNMKGGVGKTTISAHVFRVLFRLKGAGTLLLDIDPQFNLTQTLFKRVTYDDLKAKAKTIMAAMEPSPQVGMFQIKTSTEPPPPVADLGVNLKYMANAHEEKLTIVPGDFGLVKYSLMDDNRKLGAVRERFLKFVEQAKSHYKVICIDCNPSSSFLTLCALHACTHVLVPVRPDRYSILGLELLSDFVDSIPSIVPKPKIMVVLNGMPRKGAKPIETDIRAHKVFGKNVLAAMIYESDLLRASPDYTGFATDKPVPWKKLLTGEITTVAAELATKLGIP